MDTRSQINFYDDEVNDGNIPSCSLDDLSKEKERWSLASDLKLLEVLKDFSTTFFDRSHKVCDKIDDLSYDATDKSTKVSNVVNDLQKLANSQFIENRVYDEEIDDVIPEVHPVEQNQSNDLKLMTEIRNSLISGIAILSASLGPLKPPVVPVQEDSDDDEEENFVNDVYVAMQSNKFTKRPLAHLIGSEGYVNDTFVGIGPSQENQRIISERVVEVAQEAEEAVYEDYEVISTASPHKPSVSRLRGYTDSAGSFVAAKIPVESSSESDDDIFTTANKFVPQRSLEARGMEDPVTNSDITKSIVKPNVEIGERRMSHRSEMSSVIANNENSVDSPLESEDEQLFGSRQSFPKEPEAPKITEHEVSVAATKLPPRPNPIRDLQNELNARLSATLKNQKTTSSESGGDTPPIIRNSNPRPIAAPRTEIASAQVSSVFLDSDNSEDELFGARIEKPLAVDKSSKASERAPVSTISTLASTYHEEQLSAKQTNRNSDQSLKNKLTFYSSSDSDDGLFSSMKKQLPVKSQSVDKSVARSDLSTENPTATVKETEKQAIIAKKPTPVISLPKKQISIESSSDSEDGLFAFNSKSIQPSRIQKNVVNGVKSDSPDNSILNSVEVDESHYPEIEKSRSAVPIQSSFGSSSEQENASAPVSHDASQVETSKLLFEDSKENHAISIPPNVSRPTAQKSLFEDSDDDDIFTTDSISRNVPQLETKKSLLDDSIKSNSIATVSVPPKISLLGEQKSLSEDSDDSDFFTTHSRPRTVPQLETKKSLLEDSGQNNSIATVSIPSKVSGHAAQKSLFEDSDDSDIFTTDSKPRNIPQVETKKSSLEDSTESNTTATVSDPLKISLLGAQKSLFEDSDDGDIFTTDSKPRTAPQLETKKSLLEDSTESNTIATVSNLPTISLLGAQKSLIEESDDSDSFDSEPISRTSIQVETKKPLLENSVENNLFAPTVSIPQIAPQIETKQSLFEDSVENDLFATTSTLQSAPKLETKKILPKDSLQANLAASLLSAPKILARRLLLDESDDSENELFLSTNSSIGAVQEAPSASDIPSNGLDFTTKVSPLDNTGIKNRARRAPNRRPPTRKQPSSLAVAKAKDFMASSDSDDLFRSKK
ncbi:hypothetical protein HDE_02477 [Halotydeus destructor]|nr:hypothetical protein HDE_02477 [Halotydeus destructor]